MFQSAGKTVGLPPPAKEGGMSTIRDRLFQEYLGGFPVFHDEIDAGGYSHDVGDITSVEAVDPDSFGIGQFCFGIGIQGLFVENIFDGRRFI